MTEAPGYADLELRLLGRRGGSYPVEMTLDGEREYSGGMAADVLPWVPTPDPAADGVRLFEHLFADRDLRAAWDEIDAGASPKTPPPSGPSWWTTSSTATVSPSSGRG